MRTRSERAPRIGLWLLSSLAFAVACSRPLVERQRMPDGSFAFRCREELWRCLTNVDVVCKGESYEVLYASDEKKLFGTTESQVESHDSRATVRCLKPGQEPAAPPALAIAPAANTPHPVPEPRNQPTPTGAPRSATPAGPATPSRACTPGATQACVGAAACAGGQACLADGSGFGPCDCGPAPSSAPAP